jgi:hypothetical protein
MAMKKEENLSKEKLQAEIDRLKKELKNRKKYGLVWEEKPEEVVEMCKKKLPVLKEVKNREIMTDPTKPVNLLIEGDNYHALSVLNIHMQRKLMSYTLIRRTIPEIINGNTITVMSTKMMHTNIVNGCLSWKSG